MTETPKPPARGDYGIDAPGVVRNLAFAAGGALLAGTLAYTLLAGRSPRLAVALANMGIWSGLAMMASAGLMVLSSKVGKLRERERLMDALALRGDERVLDVGCGRGLLLNAAARRLTTGRAVGVDLWQTEDQSGNSPEVTLENARVEGVADRVEVKTADARELPFDDASFDVVVSNLALHNIYDAEGRARAVREIGRVLAPGGRAALLDFRNTDEYEATLRAINFEDVRRSGPRFTIYPPVRMVSGRKPVR